MNRRLHKTQGRPFVRYLPVAALLAVQLFASGCTYYNTFYLARKYYDQAQRATQRNAADKLPPDAVRKYEDAITQCGKVLTYHGKSRWVDDAIYLMGACYHGKREYDTALKKFDELQANYPESDLIPSAIFMTGLCHFGRHDYQKMEVAFNTVLQEYPRFERMDDILFTLGQAAEARGDRAEAIHRYRDLVTRFPGKPRGEEALLRIGDLYFEAGLHDSAYASFGELVRTTHTDKTFQDGTIRAADALVRMGRAGEAVRSLEQLLPKDEDPTRASEDWTALARIHLAQAENALGNYTRAIEILRYVAEKQVATTHAPEAQFQIAYTYEVYLDSLEAAKTAYDRVSKMTAGSVFRDQAASRLKNLTMLQSLTKEVVADSVSDEEKRAEASLKIAELYLFSQNKVSEALREYREVVHRYPQSRFAPRAAYGVGWILLRKTEGTQDSALVQLRSVVVDYPATTQARGALDLLTAEGADTTGLKALLKAVKPDTAETAFRAPDRADSTGEGVAKAEPLPGSAGGPADSVDAPLSGPMRLMRERSLSPLPEFDRRGWSDSLGLLSDSLSWNRGSLSDSSRPDRRRRIEP